MTPTTKLCPGVFYHIYNRGNNRENLFREERNYAYFLRLYDRYITPIAATYAYCLLKNHFHLLIRVKESPAGESASQKFSNFFNAYSKGFNLTYRRTGALFQRPFKRVAVTSNSHFLGLITYIHHNPEKHGFVDDFRDWPHSSYPALVAAQSNCPGLEQVLSSFGGRERFLEYHSFVDLTSLASENLVDLDFDHDL